MPLFIFMFNQKSDQNLQQQQPIYSLDTANNSSIIRTQQPNNQKKSAELLEQQSKQKHEEYIASKMQKKKQLLQLMKIQSSDDETERVRDRDGEKDEGLLDDDSSSQKGQSMEASPKKQQFNVEKTKSNFAVSSQDRLGVEKYGVMSLKKGGEWVKDVIEIEEDTVTLLSIPYNIKQIKKLKISVESGSQKPRIKITYPKNQLIFSPIQTQTPTSNLPLPYELYSTLLQHNLMLNLVQKKQHQPQLQQPIFNPPPSIPHNLTTNAYIYGKLIKKSQVLGKWQERFVVINKQGLFSYRKFNQKSTMEIKYGTIKEIWTRFQIVEDMFVVKVREAVMGRKVEFGLPISKVVNNRCWLYFLVGLIPNANNNSK